MNVRLDPIAAGARENEEEADRLTSGLTRQQANWRPAEGRSWSIWQCVDHLARINQAYVPALRAAVDNCPATLRTATTVISPGCFGRCFIRQMEPPARSKYKSPAKGIPADEGDPREALQRFLASHKAMLAILESGLGADLNRLRFRNPFVPGLRFTVGTGLLIINAHDRRHLWQADRVKSAAGFPKP